MPAAGQHACPSGGIQQLAADSGRRQHGHDLHDPGAHARPVGRPHRLQGQQHRPREAGRVRPPVVSGQGHVGRRRLQPVQIPRVPGALPGDQRRSQRQRPAADAPARQLPQPLPTSSSRPVRPARNAAASAGLNASMRRACPGWPPTCHVLVISTRADAVGRNDGIQDLRVRHIIEDQQAAVPVGLQPVPHRGGRGGEAPPGIVGRQSRGVGHRGESRQQAAGVRAVDPGHQPPACLLLRPRVSGRQLCRAQAAQPGAG